MPSFDGIRRGVSTRPRPIPTPLPKERSRTGRATPRNAGFAVAVIVLVAVFALLRPNTEANSQPTAETKTISNAPAKTLPPQLTSPQGGGSEASLEDLVILDQPTDTSKPQPESENSSDTGSELSIGSSDLDASQAASNDSQPKPDTFTIRILNGGSKAGAAATLRNDLVEQSFKISSIGNAQQTYTTTMVYYQTGKRAEAELIAKALGEPAVTLEENVIAKPSDLLVVIGTDRK